MITREEVADLRPGDVVVLADVNWDGASIRGKLTLEGNGHLVLQLGDDGVFVVRRFSGAPSSFASRRTLTVISRAPRRFYVNHSRENPVLGDVVRDADNLDDLHTWRLDDEDDRPWRQSGFPSLWCSRSDLPGRLLLLVDGETGRVVPQP